MIMQQQPVFMGAPNVSNYISERGVSKMKMVVAKYGMPGRNGILVNGEKRTDNTQVYAILAVMCALTNLEEMQQQFLKTSWPTHTKHDYKDVEVIDKCIGDHKRDLLIYIDSYLFGYVAPILTLPQAIDLQCLFFNLCLFRFALFTAFFTF